MLQTTLNKIREHGMNHKGWEKLLAHLGKTKGDDEPLPFATILVSNGLEDALCCCLSAPEHNKEWRLFAVWCARQVQHLMVDPRSINALDVAERYAHGEATDTELDTACAAAWDAATGAAGAAAAAWDASGAAGAAWSAATGAAGAAGVAAWDARDAAAAAAGVAAGVAAWDARDAARDAAWDAARSDQARKFTDICEKEIRT